VSDCCLTSSEQFVSYIMAIASYISIRWWPLCTRPTRMVGLHSASSLKQQSTSRHVAPLGHIMLIRGANQSLLLLLNARCLVMKQPIRIL